MNNWSVWKSWYECLSCILTPKKDCVCILSGNSSISHAACCVYKLITQTLLWWECGHDWLWWLQQVVQWYLGRTWHQMEEERSRTAMGSLQNLLNINGVRLKSSSCSKHEEQQLYLLLRSMSPVRHNILETACQSNQHVCHLLWLVAIWHCWLQCRCTVARRWCLAPCLTHTHTHTRWF